MNEEVASTSNNVSKEDVNAEGTEPPTPTRSLKVTVVGDSGTGKTCLLMAFANNKFPEEEICCQSLFENSKGTIRVGSESSFEVPVTIDTSEGSIMLGLTDTIGTENYRSLREVFASHSDIFLVCFSVTDPQTLENVRNNWLEEISVLTPSAPFILVGMKTDLRDNEEIVEALKATGREPVTLLQGIKLAKRLGAKEYVECSAMDMVGVKEVFATVTFVTSPNYSSKRKSDRKTIKDHGACVVS